MGELDTVLRDAASRGMSLQRAVLVDVNEMKLVAEALGCFSEVFAFSRSQVMMNALLRMTRQRRQPAPLIPERPEAGRRRRSGGVRRTGQPLRLRPMQGEIRALRQGRPGFAGQVRGARRAACS